MTGVARTHLAALVLGAWAPGSPTGAGVRLAIAVDALGERFSRVDVVSMSAPGDERRVDPAVHLVPWPDSPSRWTYAIGLVRGGSPFVGIRTSKLAKRVRELTREGQLSSRYDLVWSHFVMMAPTGVTIPAGARVLDADYSVAAAAERVVGGASLRQRIYSRLDAAAATRCERRLCRMFDHVVVASDLERDRLGDVGRPVTVIPNAVPEHESHRALTSPGDRLLFVGSLDYAANVDAVRLLVREILPRVRSRLPASQLTIVGRNPSEEVLALAQAPGVRLIANSASLEPFYATARAVVAPLTSGGGTRIKVLEAMARSRAIVATPTGVEGLRLSHGTSALIAEDPSELARYCIALLEDPTLADRLGRKARDVWSRDHRPATARAAVLQVVDSTLAFDGPSAGVSVTAGSGSSSKPLSERHRRR